MPQIEISKDGLDFARKLAEEIDAQDNRCTARPYFYVIQEKRVEAVPEGCGDFVRWLHCDGELMDEDDVRDWLELDDSADIPDIADEREELTAISCVERWVTPENHNVFFTEKAIKKHIKANAHHWGETRTYVRHAWRNPEMEGALSALREIAEGARFLHEGCSDE